jgi:uncharacterized membrane protein YqaE (UPF0057 family)
MRLLLTILMPPLAVFLQEGPHRAFRLNLLLTLLGYVPGLVHALRLRKRPALPRKRHV